MGILIGTQVWTTLLDIVGNIVWELGHSGLGLELHAWTINDPHLPEKPCVSPKGIARAFQPVTWLWLLPWREPSLDQSPPLVCSSHPTPSGMSTYVVWFLYAATFLLLPTNNWAYLSLVGNLIRASHLTINVCTLVRQQQDLLFTVLIFLNIACTEGEVISLPYSIRFKPYMIFFPLTRPLPFWMVGAAGLYF